MLPVVLDTNIVVTGLRSRRGASHRLLNTLEDRTWQPAISVAVALEYEDVLKRTGLVPDLTPQDIDDFLDYLFSRSNLVLTVPRLRPTLRDPDDDRILELAVGATALVVTYNSADFAGANRYGVEVLSPQELLRRLGRI